ncbi:hypothetical protein [Brevibacterium spongiae]|uniref:Secreted protein n=1 Tax=Brevibacterium spongiae TaxID=2909672 RepID=A0ABY5SWK4_9MICO|nr:hypothetical protein [Brevibacterium spongiae]UVI37084.1 hypothetical protein L1F31_05365 [Brevibacterium spongiae]
MYRRRRITLGVLTLIVIVLFVVGIVAIVNALGSSSDEDKTAAEPEETSETTTAAPVPDEKAASGRCPEDKVSLKAKVDPKSVKDGQEPEFGMVIGNGHNATCLIEVGTKQQEFIVEKDGDVVWSSKYCAAPKDENSEVSTEFAPQSEKTAKLKWNRIKVDKNCNRAKDDFAPGEYDLIVKLDDKESKPTQFELEKSAADKAKEKKAEEEKKKSDEDKKSDEPQDEQSQEPQD